MNRYKIVSLVLAFALLASLVVVVKQSHDTPEADPVGAVLGNIHARRSVRAYADRQVTPETIDTLLRAAMAAPTARDRRPWRFVVVDDRRLLDSLGAQLPYAGMLLGAPAAIAVCGQLTEGVDPAEEMWMQDCAAATENLLLAAQAIGLGAVWTGVYPYADRVALVSRLLRLPPDVVPLNVIPIGYPGERTEPKQKFDRKNIHHNGW